MENRTLADECKPFPFSCGFKNRTSSFSHPQSFMPKKKETNELYKEEKGKREVRIPAAVFADVRVLVD